MSSLGNVHHTPDCYFLPIQPIISAKRGDDLYRLELGVSEGAEATAAVKPSQKKRLYQGHKVTRARKPASQVYSSRSKL